MKNIILEGLKVKLNKISANIVNVNVSVVGQRESFDLKKLMNLKKVKVNNLTFKYRKVYFDGKWFDTKIFWRDYLPKKYKICGPAIIEQMDSTIVINPDDIAVVDNFGNLIIDIGLEFMKLDNITLSVIQAGLQQVCDEMDLSFSRSAFFSCNHRS